MRRIDLLNFRLVGKRRYHCGMLIHHDVMENHFHCSLTDMIAGTILGAILGAILGTILGAIHGQLAKVRGSHTSGMSHYPLSLFNS